jgi:protein involved in sex pheromone biosynthesis
MKKVLGIIAVLALLLVVSCGPSTKELEEKRIQDSIKAADSLALVIKEKQIADSIAIMKADSIKKDSIAKLKIVKKHKKLKKSI